MAIEKTILNNEKIIKILTKEYGLIGKAIITYIDRGTSNIFKININDQKYILKEFQSETTPNKIEKEINIIQYLSTKGILVPKYLTSTSGKCYIKYENKIIIMQEFIEGNVIDDNQATYDQIIKAGKTYGKLINVMKDYPNLTDEGWIKAKLSREYLIKSMDKINKAKAEIKPDNPHKLQYLKDYEFKLKIAKELINQFDFNIINKLTISNTHGDYSTLQLIRDDNNEITIIDFEEARKMPIIWEIMRSYCYMDKETKEGKINITTLKQYTKEVNKYFKLNKYDLKYASYIFLIQLTGSLFGYKEYNNDYEQKNLLRFALVRTKISKNLYENLDKIGEELLTILEEN